MVSAVRAPAYARRVSQIERSYLAAAAAGSDCAIRLVVEGTGALALADLRAAVDVAAAAHPGLSALRRGGLWRGGGPAPRVVASSLPVDDDPRIRAELSVRTGPVAEIRLHPGGDGGTAVLFRATHAVTDGHGVMDFARDVFRVLRGEAPTGNPDALGDEHFVRAAGRSGAPAGGTDPVPAPWPVRAPGLRWVRREVPGRLSGGAGRVAAAVRAAAPGPARVMVPVDLRRHDPAVRSSANLTAPVFVDLPVPVSSRAVQAELLAALLDNREVAGLGADYGSANRFARTLAEATTDGSAGLPVTAIVSDHGAVPDGAFDAPGFRAVRVYTMPMWVPYAATFVSLVHAAGRTVLTAVVADTPDAVAAIERVLAAAVEEP
ncbi:hypothetical protein TPB0596_37750 [Tsukamurella pulmonis]|nr:hypothetical protein TPB0596_37750 [Tsukamurella pulmonis]